MKKLLVTMLALATIFVSLAILIPPNPASAVPSFPGYMAWHVTNAIPRSLA